MPVSGLVITLASDDASASAALASLEADGRLELGVRRGRRVAAVADTHSPQENKSLWQSLTACDGIAHVDVVFVDLEHDGPGTPNESASESSKP